MNSFGDFFFILFFPFQWLKEKIFQGDYVFQSD